MNIDWSAVNSNSEYIRIKKFKDSLYDFIIGELNRISVSDDFEEKEYLLSCLKHNIVTYYDYSIECTKILLKYSKE